MLADGYEQVVKMLWGFHVDDPALCVIGVGILQACGRSLRSPLAQMSREERKGTPPYTPINC
jgi:hypothetical protein